MATDHPVQRMTPSLHVETSLRAPSTALAHSILVMVMRVLQERWGQSSRHVVEVGAYKCEDVFLLHPTKLPIPIVLLCVYPHVRLLPEIPRMDPTLKATD